MNKLLFSAKTSSEKMPSSDSETIIALQRLLKERNEEILEKDKTITMLEKELDEKHAQIIYLKNEIDKFRQVVNPLTQKIIHKKILLGDELCMVEEEKAPNNGFRTKRQAISAEPLPGHGNEMQTVKIPKSLK